MNRQTLEEPTISTNEDLEIDEDLEDDPNEPEIIWNMEEIAQISADIDAGLIKLIPWEQVKTKLHATD